MDDSRMVVGLGRVSTVHVLNAVPCESIATVFFTKSHVAIFTYYGCK